jgi:hypothetical protein
MLDSNYLAVSLLLDWGRNPSLFFVATSDNTQAFAAIAHDKRFLQVLASK